MFFLLKRNADSLSVKTFDVVYEDIRIDNEKLYYYLFRYYKLLAIAIIIAVGYNASKGASIFQVILLMILHAVDFILLKATNPLGMVQP